MSAPKNTPEKNPTSWLDQALRKLNHRDYAEGEMFQKLVDLECPETDAARVVQQLKEMGYLNDERLMQAQARSCRARRRGPGYLWQRLRHRGMEISRTQAVELYREAGGSFSGELPPDESILIGEEAQRAWTAVSRRETDARKARQKVAARLIRRGFTPDLVFRAVERLGR